MKYDLKYWQNYESDIISPSAFAEYCLPYIKGSVLDVCSGNCRDSDFFYNKGLSVSAFDLRHRSKPYDYNVVNLYDRDSWRGTDNIYFRFVLHVFPEEIEDFILIQSYHSLPVGGYLFIEARSNKGIHDKTHYRRLIDFNTLRSKIVNLGFEIIEEHEDYGFSIDYDNPILIRIIARKAGDIQAESLISWEEFNYHRVISYDSSAHLLLSIKKILSEITFYLAFGTLLGAYRDGVFIKHDTDVDVVLLKDSLVEIDKLYIQGYFALYGLQLIRWDKWVRTFRYKDDYIDLYFFEKRGDRYCLGQSYSIADFQIDNEPSKINFIGTEFTTFHNVEQYLLDQYGSDWQTPIKYV